MKTIRLTVIAILAAALAEVAIGPVPAGAAAPPAPTCVIGTNYNRCLTGSFAFRVSYAKSFAESLAVTATAAGSPVGISDPAGVEPPYPPLQNMSVVRTGTFTANGNNPTGGMTGHSQTLVSDQYGTTTLKVDYHWGGSYTLNADMTGTLIINPAISSFTCTDETTGSTTSCSGYEVGPETYAISYSVINGVLNMVETDNNARSGNAATLSGAGGAKIFMTGQAIKQ